MHTSYKLTAKINISDHMVKVRQNITNERHHRLLWPEDTTFLKSQRAYLVTGGCHSCLWLEAIRFALSQVRRETGTNGHCRHTLPLLQATSLSVSPSVMVHAHAYILGGAFDYRKITKAYSQMGSTYIVTINYSIIPESILMNLISYL